MSTERAKRYAETLSRLIQVPTVSGSDRKVFYEFQTLLKERFPHLLSQVIWEDYEGGFLLRWKGRDPDLAPVLFMSHHDVVEAPGPWTYPPFSGTIAEGKLWGRGTLDTKGNLFAMLQAADELAEGGFLPGCDLYFASTCNEETTGQGGQLISQALWQRGLRFRFILDEGGMIVREPVTGVKGVYAMIGVGEKGACNLRFVARSKGGHASTPGKNSPLVRLGKFMAAADETGCFKVHISPTLEELLRRLSAGLPTPLSAAVSRVGKVKPFAAPMLGSMGGSVGAMVRTTIAFTQASGSPARNVLPEEAWVVGNLRFSHHQGQEGSIKAITKLAKKYGVETEVLEQGIDSPITDFNGEPFRLVEQVIGQVYPEATPAPYVMNGASDSRFYSRVSKHCLRFAPFLISNDQLSRVHGLDENLDVDTLERGVDFFRLLMERL